MARTKKAQPEAEPTTNSQADLAAAIVEAIRSTQPDPGFVKKTVQNKKSQTPWMPKDGSPRARLKRRAYHHGLLLGDPKEPSCRLSNLEIELFNQLRPGDFCNGYVKVKRRRDKGIDIDYPMKTSSQRLRLVNDFGIRSFAELLQKCVTEAAQPKVAATDEDDD